MRYLKNVTLCCIDNQFPAKGYEALINSVKNIKFEKVLFFTKSDFLIPSGSNIDVEVRYVDHIQSITSYSHFLIKELAEYINTSHVLIVQWDGFILSPESWSDSFLDYDYIGAIWGEPGNFVVGNGGFSLRSSRLLAALKSDEIQVGHPEDRIICVDNKAILEDKFNIRFAPVQLAQNFSFESIESDAKTFGFHGFFNLPKVLEVDELIKFIETMDDEIILHGHWAYFYENCIGMNNFLVLSLIEKKIENLIKKAQPELLSSKKYRSLIKSCLHNKSYKLAHNALLRKIKECGLNFDNFLLFIRIFYRKSFSI
jgi:hypothetical protein